MNKEKWIEEVMSSVDDIKSAEASPFLYSKILHKTTQAKTDFAPARLVWLAAACFLILLLLNFQIVKKGELLSQKKNELQELASQFNLLNTNSVNY